MRPDYIQRDPKTKVIEAFKEYVLLTHTYACCFDIQEASIRAAIIENRLPITEK